MIKIIYAAVLSTHENKTKLLVIMLQNIKNIFKLKNLLVRTNLTVSLSCNMMPIQDKLTPKCLSTFHYEDTVDITSHKKIKVIIPI